MRNPGPEVARRPRFLWLTAGITLTLGLGCFCCGPPEPCPQGQIRQIEACVAADCGEYPFGGWMDGDYVYVEADPYDEHGPDPDGSSDWPYRTIGRGVREARKRHVPVVVASGTYNERLALDDRDDGLEIHGVCSTTTTLVGGSAVPTPDHTVNFGVTGVNVSVVTEGDDPGPVPTIALDASPDTVVRIEDLHVSNDQSVGIAVTSGQLELDGVSVDAAVLGGVTVEGANARLEMSNGTVSDVAAPAGGGDGVGVVAANGASLVGSALEVKRSGVVAVLIDGADADLAGLTTSSGPRDDQDEETPPKPAGVIATDGATLSLSDADLSDSWSVGVEVSLASTATLDRVAIHGVRAGGAPANQAGGGFGSGVTVLDGSSLAATDLTVEGAALYGLGVGGEDTTVTVRGGSIGSSDPDPDQPTAGVGVAIDSGATVELTDVDLTRDHVYAVIASGSGSAVTLTDVALVDTQPTDAFAFGGGLLVQEGADAVATRVDVNGSGTVGVLVDASTATLTDLTVRDTVRGPLQSTAVGVAAQNGAAVSADGLVVRRTEGPGVMAAAATFGCAGCTLTSNAFAGALVADGGRLTLTDGLVADTVADATDGGGVGLYALSGVYRSRLVVERTEVSGNLHAAAYLDGNGDLTLTDDTLVGGAAERAVWPRGTAVFATGTTASGLRIAGCTIEGSEGAGLFFDGASATLVGNAYLDNAIDVVQQLCSASVPAPAGIEDEPVSTVELCPVYDYPVDPFAFTTVYTPVDLGSP